jgi:hypothetical protein
VKLLEGTIAGDEGWVRVNAIGEVSGRVLSFVGRSNGFVSVGNDREADMNGKVKTREARAAVELNPRNWRSSVGDYDKIRCCASLWHERSETTDTYIGNQRTERRLDLGTSDQRPASQR